MIIYIIVMALVQENVDVTYLVAFGLGLGS